LQTWRSARADQQAKWAGDFSDALAAAPDSDPSQVKPGDYGPVPVLAARFLTRPQRRPRGTAHLA
jgi:hypothetical protein